MAAANPNVPPSLAPAFARSGHPYLMWEQIESIPEVLARMPDADEAAAAELERVREALRGARAVYLIGCGTSLFAGLTAERWLEAATGLPSHARDAFEFFAYPPASLEGYAVVAISHTGGTASVLQAVRLARARGARTVAVTDVEESPLARAADAALPWPTGAEPALPKTRSYVTTLYRLRRLASALAAPGAAGAGLPAAPSAAEVSIRAREVLLGAESTAEETARLLAPGLAAGGAKVVLVGAGPHLATAQEGALKLQETSQVPALAFELEEVMHGPWTLIGENDLVVLVAGDGPAWEKTLGLARALHPLGAVLWVIGGQGVEEMEATAATQLPAWPEVDAPLLAILPLYLFAYRLSLALGRRPDSMRLTDERYLAARLKLPR